MKTKIVVHVMVEVEHPEGTKLRKKAVAQYLKAQLEDGDADPTSNIVIQKAVIRAVDLD